MKLLYSIFLFSVIYTVAFILPSSAEEEKVFIAVVGGTSFGAPEKFGQGLVENEGFIQIETPVGLGPKLYRMRYKGVPFYYVRMYGYETYIPSENDENVHHNGRDFHGGHDLHDHHGHLNHINHHNHHGHHGHDHDHDHDQDHNNVDGDYDYDYDFGKFNNLKKQVSQN